MELKDLREEINVLDAQMAELFGKRMEMVSRIAEYKQEHGLAVEDREREHRVINEKSMLIEDEALRPYYVQFMQATMDVSKRWQERLNEGQQVAYCGGENVRAAARQHFPSGRLDEYSSYEEAYEAVVKGDCSAAVLPFEKSYEGEVGPVIDLIFSGELYVNDIEDVRDDTGITRYAVLSRAENKLTPGSEGSTFILMFTVKDEVGGLAKAVNTISAFNFNMQILRSRPMQDLPWHYYFYAEAVGDDNSENGRRMLTALSAVCPKVKVVGRYSR